MNFSLKKAKIHGILGYFFYVLHRKNRDLSELRSVNFEPDGLKIDPKRVILTLFVPRRCASRYLIHRARPGDKVYFTHKWVKYS